MHIIIHLRIDESSISIFFHTVVHSLINESSLWIYFRIMNTFEVKFCARLNIIRVSSVTFVIYWGFVNSDANQILREIACFFSQSRGHFGEVFNPSSAFHRKLIHGKYLCLALWSSFHGCLSYFLKWSTTIDFLEDFSLWMVWEYLCI